MQGNVQLDVQCECCASKGLTATKKLGYRKKVFKRHKHCLYFPDAFSYLAGHNIWRATAQCKQDIFPIILLYSTIICSQLHPLSAALFPVPPDQELIVGLACKLGGGTDHQSRLTSKELPFSQVLCFVRY